MGGETSRPSSRYQRPGRLNTRTRAGHDQTNPWTTSSDTTACWSPSLTCFDHVLHLFISKTTYAVVSLPRFRVNESLNDSFQPSVVLWWSGHRLPVSNGFSLLILPSPLTLSVNPSHNFIFSYFSSGMHFHSIVHESLPSVHDHNQSVFCPLNLIASLILLPVKPLVRETRM